MQWVRLLLQLEADRSIPNRSSDPWRATWLKRSGEGNCELRARGSSQPSLTIELMQRSPPTTPPKMATFGPSSSGTTIITGEPSTPISHVVFAVITVALTLLQLFYTLIMLLAAERNPEHNPSSTDAKALRWHRYRRVLFTLITGNALIHGAHYADNILRPVSYHEPKFLYQRYLVSSMEITFFINLPAVMINITAFEGLRLRVPSSFRSGVKWMLLYLAEAYLTLGHYRVDPPSAYSTWVNFTIGGEGVVATLLLLWLVYGYFTVVKDMDEDWPTRAQRQEACLRDSGEEDHAGVSSEDDEHAQLIDGETTRRRRAQRGTPAFLRPCLGERNSYFA